MEYKEAMELNPVYTQAHYNLGLAYYSQGQFNEAIVEYRIALILKANDVKTYNNLGLAYLNLGMFDKAINEFKAALRLKPDDPRPYYNLGNTYFKQNRLRETIAAFQHALLYTRNPALTASIHNNLGNAYDSLGLQEKAVIEYKETLRIMPDHKNASRKLEIVKRRSKTIAQ
jgi:tetratricopeptide (TPR) repeat protein